MRRLAVVFLAALVAAAAWGVGPVFAQSTGSDNGAVAVNTRDNSFVFQFAFKVTRAGGDVVDAANGAAAVASCSYCETVAVAIQVVLVTGDPSTFTPTNVALAYNQGCNECTTLADAFQFVFGTGGLPAHLTAAGNRQLADIRRQYELLRQSSLPPDELQAKIVALANEVYQVFSTQLVTGPAATAGQQTAPTTSTVPSPSTTAVSGTESTVATPTTVATSESTTTP